MDSAPRPLLVFDGECSFCRTWIERWRRIIGTRIEYGAYQEVAGRVPGVTREALAGAVHLVEPGGRVTRGAEAVFRSLAYAPGHGWGLRLYRFVPGFAPLAEACYAWVARHRPLCERITRAIWGPGPPPA